MTTKPNAAALKRFEEKFGKSFGAETMKRSADVSPYDIIPTGSITLDYITGVGGLVTGRIYEIWGVDAIGKTTLTLLTMAEAQRKFPDKMVAWIDMERTFDEVWADAHGVDRERLYLVKPDNAEDVADMMKEFVTSGLFSFVVLDSIGAMIPEVEKEKDADQATMAVQAKVVTRMVKIAAVEADKTKTTVMLVNQVRANLSYGADTTTGGGFALKHVTTMKFKLRSTGKRYEMTIAGEKVTVGHEVAVLTERNKVAPPRRTANISLFNQTTAKYGPIGVDRVDEAVELGVKLGVIGQAGAWYTLPTTGERFNGRDKLVEGLRAQPEEVDRIRTAILATVSDEVVIGEEGDPLADEKRAGFKGTDSLEDVG